MIRLSKRLAPLFVVALVASYLLTSTTPVFAVGVSSGIALDPSSIPEPVAWWRQAGAHAFAGAVAGGIAGGITGGATGAASGAAIGGAAAIVYYAVTEALMGGRRGVTSDEGFGIPGSALD